MRMQTLANGQIMVTIKELEISYIADDQKEAIEKAWELSNEKADQIN